MEIHGDVFLLLSCIKQTTALDVFAMAGGWVAAVPVPGDGTAVPGQVPVPGESRRKCKYSTNKS